MIQKKKKESSGPVLAIVRRDILAFFLASVSSLLAFVLAISILGNKNEIFSDYIIETVAMQNQNINNELKLFWVIALVPSIILLLLVFKKARQRDEKIISTSTGLLIVSLLANIFQFFINSSISMPLLLISIFLVLGSIFSNHRLIHNITVGIVSYYSIQGLYTLVTYLGINIEIPTVLLQLVAVLFSLVCLSVITGKEKLGCLFFILELFIPLNLLSFLQDKYLFDNRVITIKQPFAFVAFQITLLLFSYFLLFSNRRRARNKSSVSRNLVSAATIIIIAICGSISTPAKQLVDGDLQHKPEDTLSYVQVTKLNRQLYNNYTPTSGLFSVVGGFFLHLMGDDMTQCNLSEILFFELFVMLDVILLILAFDKNVALFASASLILISVDRSILLLPCLLLLAIPRLIKNRNTWLKAWCLSCYVTCLFYPAFGLAFSVGTMPFAIFQAIKFFKKDWLKIYKKPSFWFLWVLVLLPIVIKVPFLLKYVSHIQVYASQTNLADGIATFGQKAYSSFMSYLPDRIRNILYAPVRHILPAMIVWFAFFPIAKILKSKRSVSGTVSAQIIFLATSLPILVIFAFLGAIVRNDYIALTSRTRNIVVPIVAVILSVLMVKLFKNTAEKYVSIAILAGLLLLFQASPIINSTKSANPFYVSSDQFSLITDETRALLPNIGHGFIQNDNLVALLSAQEKLEPYINSGLDLEYAIIGKMGYYQALELPAIGNPRIHAIKDYKTSKELIQLIKQAGDRVIIGTELENTSMRYYLYHWLMTDDNYVYEEKTDKFMTRNLFNQLFGKDTSPSDKANASFSTVDLGLIPGSTGNSFKSLESIFENVPIETTKKQIGNRFSVNLETKLSGREADFIYLEFDIDGPINSQREHFLKKHNYNIDIVVAIYKDGEKEPNSTCVLLDGKLLIPVGENTKWITDDEIDKITIEVEGSSKELNLTKIEFYSLITERG